MILIAIIDVIDNSKRVYATSEWNLVAGIVFLIPPFRQNEVSILSLAILLSARRMNLTITSEDVVICAKDITTEIFHRIVHNFQSWIKLMPTSDTVLR